MTSLRHNTLEDIRHERVHHSHSSLGNTAIRMHLLQNLVDVGGVGVDLGGPSLLLVIGGILHGSLLILSSRHAL